ncbi:hypothetical protein IWW57_006536 [Coemansia sp. S610]|nr:hypothetical protein IWW57_006536 [Coemansia sp. S610]
MNIIALFLAQAIFEPRKRRKIVAGVDERLAAAMNEQHTRIGDIGLSVGNRLQSHEESIASIAAHLARVSAMLASIASKQEAEMAVLGSQLLGSPQGNVPAMDATDLMKIGGDGYSDTELDMYYAQQNAQPQRLIPGSMIWRAVQQEKQSDKHTATSFSRSEARQLALESAALAGIMVAGLLSAYFST